MIKTKRGMEITLSTIIVIVLLLITAIAVIIFFRDKFTALIGSFDKLFGKTDLIIESVPYEL